MANRRDPILSIDFADLYRQQWDRSSFGLRRADDWDRRAAERHRTLQLGNYEKAFLERMDLSAASSVLDIGCGTGNLAIPLAQQGLRVYALDFSRKMLEFVKINARQVRVRNIRTYCLSWTDSWRFVPVADIAICSRALGVRDLRSALLKMSRHARKRCYATITAQGCYLSEDILHLLRRTVVPRPDYIYAVNVLYQLGYRARVDFITSPGGRAYRTEQDFISGVEWRIGKLTRLEKELLGRFFQELPINDQGERVHTHEFEWAFLAWETS